MHAYAKKKALPLPMNLGEAVKLIAKIGGHLGRVSDPPPGHQVLWRGYTKFGILCFAFSLLNDDT
jgi:hypothetical protein